MAIKSQPKSTVPKTTTSTAVIPVSHFTSLRSKLYVKEEHRMKLLISILLGIVIIALAGLFYFYLQVRSLQSPSVKAQQETKDLVGEIGRYMILPTDETPTLATVSDPSKLQDQTFFAHAQVGDKVLIYTRNKKAILYSPSMHKIVEVAPVSLNTNPANQ
jgi:hypothetical protein